MYGGVIGRLVLCMRRIQATRDSGTGHVACSREAAARREEKKHVGSQRAHRSSETCVVDGSVGIDCSIS
jgi:hypothetical protein